MKTLVLAIFLFGTFAHAQLSTNASESYQDQVESLSTSALAAEVSVKLALTSWYCGSDIAKRIYNDIQAGNKPHIVKSNSSDCIAQSYYLSVSAQEAFRRAHIVAVSKGFADPVVTYYNFSIKIPNITPSAIAESGSGFCLDTARKAFATWMKDGKAWDSFTQLQPNTTIVCQAQRNDDNEIGFFSCSHWMNASLINFKTGDIYMPAESRKALTPKEIEQIRKPVKDKNDMKELTDWLRFDIDAGIEILPFISTAVGGTTAVFEVRGIKSPDWNDAMRKPGGERNFFEAPAACSVKTKIDFSVGQVSPGKLPETNPFPFGN